MNSVIRLVLRSAEDGKVTPSEVLRYFSDATPGWVFLEEDSRHYTNVKDAASLVVRHRVAPSTYVDLAFTGAGGDEDTLELAVQDPVASDVQLSGSERMEQIEVFLEAMRDYLDTRPDHVTLHVEQREPGETASG